MRYILITFAGPERVASWNEMSVAEKEADIARVMGGFIVVDVDSQETALEMARTWPGLVFDTDRVEVWSAGSSPDEAKVQAQAEAG